MTASLTILFQLNNEAVTKINYLQKPPIPTTRNAEHWTRNAPPNPSNFQTLQTFKLLPVTLTCLRRCQVVLLKLLFHSYITSNLITRNIEQGTRNVPPTLQTFKLFKHSNPSNFFPTKRNVPPTLQMRNVYILYTLIQWKERNRRGFRWSFLRVP